MKVMIGVDPHKGSHTATMLDRTERELARIKVRAGRDQLGELLEWADGVSPRTRAVESAGGMAICSPSNWSPLARRCSTCRRCWPHGSGCSALVSPPRPIRTRPARSLSPRCMLRRSPWCAGLTCDGVPAAGQAPHRLARWRTKQCCRLHALVVELMPGGIDKEVVVNQARSLLENSQPGNVAAIERHRQAVELVTDIEHLDAVLKDSRIRISAAVAASQTTLTDIFGVGPIIAAMVIGFSGNPLRFTTASRYAAYTGTAPIEFSSGGRVTHRLSRRGNRRLNHALHCAAITQIRHRHSPGRGYYERKLAEGKTPREAIRALKRRLSDIVWRHLIADAQRATS